jgi:cell division protein FtsN
LAIELESMRTVVQRAPPLVPRGVILALGLGVAFGAGLVVGGSGQANAVNIDGAPARDPLVLAANRSAALEETRAALKLTYASELVRPDPPAPRRPPPPKVAAAPAVRREEASAPLEAPPASMPPPPPLQMPTAQNDEPAGDAIEDVDKRSGEDLKAALARVVEDLQPTAGFSLQVAAAATQAGADDVVRKLAAQGHSARVIEGQVGGHPVFRVRVGAFTDRAQADAYKAKLAMPAFIVNE